jgi:two-component system chemotaxis sensor kinase CheA
MSVDATDPSLLADFLTESSELIETLDADLVKLESAGAAQSQELCNSCFRALHTIKGAASFLGLTDVTTFAHAAEDALNRLRKGELAISEPVMDALLQSADVVRRMIRELSTGQTVSEGPAELVSQLHAIADGQADSAPPAANTACTSKATTKNESEPGEPMNLGPQKLDLLEFMVADLLEYARQIDLVVEQLNNDATRGDAADHLAEIAEGMAKTADFFELNDLTAAVLLLGQVAPKLHECPGELMSEIVIRIHAIKSLIDQQADALTRQRALVWSLGTITQRLTTLAAGTALPANITGKHQGDIALLLALDGVLPSPAAAQQTEAPSPTAVHKSNDTAPPAGADDTTENSAAAPLSTITGEKSAGPSATVAEQTIRVEVSRLESLLNLVGQLVLNKNRVLALTRAVRDADIRPDLAEDFTAAAGDLDRLMGELQVGVMRTRMQPLAKLFDRYPRVIRDMARLTEKKINLLIVGKETEVDKTVLEQLADPLVHLLRNCADHGIEAPDNRLANSKPDVGTIRLEAEHQGSHVRVAITDDGKGLDREILGKKAVERGLVTAEQLAGLSDQEVFRFIFHAGFSTAEKVSDLSGRGVGMDVVRTNVAKLNGTINLSSKKGAGTTIEILIPLTVAIMPAMVVGVGAHLYSIPLQSIIEIVRPESAALHSVHGQPVMRLRDLVLPLVDMEKRLDETHTDHAGKFAVVVSVGGYRAGLLVDRLVGQQEVVIKPLDDAFTKGGPFSGATIQEDGQVCLILDVMQLVRTAQHGSQHRPGQKLAA